MLHVRGWAMRLARPRCGRSVAGGVVVCTLAVLAVACGVIVGEPAGIVYPRLSIEGEIFGEIEALQVRIYGEHIDAVEEIFEVADGELVIELPAGGPVTVELRSLEPNGDGWRAGLYRGLAETPVLQAGAETVIVVPVHLPEPAGAGDVTWVAAATAGSADEFEQAISSFLEIDAGEGEAFMLLVNDNIDVVGDWLDAHPGGDIYIIGESLDEERLITFDGGGDSRILNAFAPQPNDFTFHVERLRFVDGYHNSSGGAIRAPVGYTRLAVFDSEFVGNQVNLDFGGAIRFGTPANPVDSVQITRSRFVNNQAADDGGAISVAANTVGVITIDESEFIGNGADLGGAVWVSGDDGTVGEFEIKDSVFRQNSAIEQGGAVGGPNIESIDITRSTFEENEAGTGGSVAWTNLAELRSEGSSYINNNTPLFDGFATLTDGGGNVFEPEAHEPAWGLQGE